MEWLIPYKIDDDTPSAGAQVASATLAGSFLQGCRRIAASALGRAGNNTTTVDYMTQCVAERLGGAVSGV